jgi:hypothetical protein
MWGECVLYTELYMCGGPDCDSFCLQACHDFFIWLQNLGSLIIFFGSIRTVMRFVKRYTDDELAFRLFETLRHSRPRFRSLCNNIHICYTAHILRYSVMIDACTRCVCVRVNPMHHTGEHLVIDACTRCVCAGQPNARTW